MLRDRDGPGIPSDVVVVPGNSRFKSVTPRMYWSRAVVLRKILRLIAMLSSFCPAVIRSMVVSTLFWRTSDTSKSATFLSRALRALAAVLIRKHIDQLLDHIHSRRKSHVGDWMIVDLTIVSDTKVSHDLFPVHTNVVGRTNYNMVSLVFSLADRCGVMMRRTLSRLDECGVFLDVGRD